MGQQNWKFIVSEESIRSQDLNISAYSEARRLVYPLFIKKAKTGLGEVGAEIDTYWERAGRLLMSLRFGVYPSYVRYLLTEVAYQLWCWDNFCSLKNGWHSSQQLLHRWEKQPLLGLLVVLPLGRRGPASGMRSVPQGWQMTRNANAFLSQLWALQDLCVDWRYL